MPKNDTKRKRKVGETRPTYRAEREAKAAKEAETRARNRARGGRQRLPDESRADMLKRVRARRAGVVAEQGRAAAAPRPAGRPSPVESARLSQRESAGLLKEALAKREKLKGKPTAAQLRAAEPGAAPVKEAKATLKKAAAPRPARTPRVPAEAVFGWPAKKPVKPVAKKAPAEMTGRERLKFRATAERLAKEREARVKKAARGVKSAGKRFESESTHRKDLERIVKFGKTHKKGLEIASPADVEKAGKAAREKAIKKFREHDRPTLETKTLEAQKRGPARPNVRNWTIGELESSGDPSAKKEIERREALEAAADRKDRAQKVGAAAVAAEAAEKKRVAKLEADRLARNKAAADKAKAKGRKPPPEEPKPTKFEKTTEARTHAVRSGQRGPTAQSSMRRAEMQRNKREKARKRTKAWQKQQQSPEWRAAQVHAAARALKTRSGREKAEAAKVERKKKKR